MAGFVADVMSVISVVMTTIGNATGITSMGTGFMNLAKGIFNGMMAYSGLIKTMMTLAALAVLKELTNSVVTCVLGFIPCLLKEVFIMWPLRLWNNIFLYTFMWLFVDAMTFPDPCIFFWVAYIVSLILYYLLEVLLSIVQMDSVLDMIYQFLQAVDMMDLTNDKLYFTRFSNSVVSKCFTTADMYYLLYFEFSVCSCPDMGLNIPDVEGIPKGTQGKLHQWSDNMDAEVADEKGN